MAIGMHMVDFVNQQNNQGKTITLITGDIDYRPAILKIQEKFQIPFQIIGI